MKKLIIYVILTINLGFVNAHVDFYKNYIYADNIKTTQIFRKGWELSPPFINLESNDKLVVTFDDMKDELGNYYYTIVQCNADWTPSELVQQDYLEGFYENPINNYHYSSNTTVNYTHYSFEFPNNDLQITKSGNYAVIVYQDFDKEKILFTKRFFIYEPIADIIANIKRPMSADFFEKGQEIDVSIIHEGYDIQNPYDEVKMVLVQNMDWNIRIDNLKPTFIRNNELVYDYNVENIFNGLSEFRYFDIKSLRYQSEYIKSITYDYQYHNVLLVPDEERHFGKYFYNDDINGKYLVDVQEFPNAETEADYVMVYFSLSYDTPLTDAEIFVYGALNDWQTDGRSMMTYNYEKKAYETRLLLKQGYYNYCYAVRDMKDPKVDIAYIEGNHYETENDYFIFLYHHPFHLRYDRLIGVQVVNSVRKNSQ